MMDFDILGFLGLGTKQIYYYAETRRVYTFNEQDLFRIMGMLCFFRVFYFKFNRQFSILRSVKMGIVGFICCAAYHDVITQTVNGYGKMLRDVDWTYGLWHPSYHKSFTILPYLQNNYFTLPRYGQLDFNWVPNLTFTDLTRLSWWEIPELVVTSIVTLVHYLLKWTHLDGIEKYFAFIYNLIFREIIDYKSIIDFVYYFEKYFGWNSFRNMVTYGFLIRVSREFLPYPVRWHWAHASVLELVNRHWINFGLSLSRTTYDMPTSSPERLAVQGLVSAHMSLTVAMIIFMMLHAVFLQYYFLPFVTESAELHSGNKLRGNHPEDGGYACWQDLPWSTRPLYKVWWGWLGKSKDDWEKQRKNKRKKRN